MPEILDRYVEALKRRRRVRNPYAVATALLQKQGYMKRGSHKLTKRGRRASANQR